MPGHSLRIELVAMNLLLSLSIGTLLVGFEWVGPAVPEVVIHVATDGNDAWSGRPARPSADRTDGPVATPGRARDRVRELRRQHEASGAAGPVVVEIQEGTYFLEAPLVLEPSDSGTREAPITWRGAPGSRVVLSGGERLTGWSRVRINDRDAWKAPLPRPEAGTPPPRELWFNQDRWTRSRWPRQGSTLAVEALAPDTPPGDWMKGVSAFRFHPGDLPAWNRVEEGDLIVANRWTESHLPLAGVDLDARIVRFARKTVFRLEPGDPYWIENIRETLTEPRTFRVDPRERAVYLITEPGVDPNQAEVVLPRMTQVLRLEGEPEKRAFLENLTFENLQFCHAEWTLDHAGVRGGAERTVEAADPTRSGFSQAAVGVPGAIGATGARRCVFRRCVVGHTGTYGIDLGRGCSENTIERCTLTDLGAGGIKIGETAIRQNPDEQTRANQVLDCTISSGGHLYPGCIGVWVGQSPENQISHNEIHGFWYTGISIGWTWGYGPALATGNRVEWNHVHHLGAPAEGSAPLLSDMAGIYTLGNQAGTVIRNNRFHDIAARTYGGWGIYFDEGTTGILAENNLVYRTSHGGFHQHYGKDNTFRNNILAFGRDAQVQRTRLEDHPSFRFERNVVLWDRGPLFAGDWKEPRAQFDFNTYWCRNGKPPRFGNRTWDEWQTLGQDTHSRISDPRFANPDQADFRATAATAFAPGGFTPFELDGVGPR